MGLLDRIRGASQNRSGDHQPRFWLTSATPSRDPSVLYQHGILCVSRQDGPAMMSTGWTIWDIEGIHAHQAFDFLRDGYRATWQGTSAYDHDIAIAFLSEVFERLAAVDPPVPDDIYSAPPELVRPAAVHYSARCWAGSELLEALADRPADRAGREPAVFEAITRSPRDFVPPRSISWAEGFAAARGLPQPWQSR